MFDYILSGIKNKVFMHTLPIAEKMHAKKTQAASYACEFHSNFLLTQGNLPIV
jgi:hypothetical protein